MGFSNYGHSVGVKAIIMKLRLTTIDGEMEPSRMTLFLKMHICKP